MKKSIQIVTGLLAVYILALPLLFGYHSTQHQHSSIGDHDSTSDSYLISSDCTLCDLYLGQTAVLENPDFSQDEIPILTPGVHFSDELVSISGDFIYLRGPPRS